MPNCSRTIGRPGDAINLTDPGYDSFSLSSSDSYPSAINCPAGKLGQIPEHMQTAFIPYDLSQLQYCLKDIKNNDHFPYGKLILVVSYVFNKEFCRRGKEGFLTPHLLYRAYILGTFKFAYSS